MNLNSQSTKYPWYSKVSASDPLQQGDFIFSCPILHPKTNEYVADQTIETDVTEYDVIVMSQSCDLIANKIELVLVCPFYPLTELEQLYPDYKSVRMKNKLLEGYIVGYHLLNESKDNNINDFLVVDFKSVYSVPMKLLKQMVKQRGQRIRLLPPYREHLSQSFARFFMRVGLPLDIPKFH